MDDGYLELISYVKCEDLFSPGDAPNHDPPRKIANNSNEFPSNAPTEAPVNSNMLAHDIQDSVSSVAAPQMVNQHHQFLSDHGRSPYLQQS